MFNYIPDFYRAETADTIEEGDQWYDNKRDFRRPPELLPRDEVARAINSEVKAGRGSPHGGVYLDIASRRSADVHPAPPALDVPPVQGARRRRHHDRPDGDRADVPLHHGRRTRRGRHGGDDGRRPLRRRRGRRRACTAPTASAATRSRTCSSSAVAPGSPRRSGRSGIAGEVTLDEAEVEEVVRARALLLRPRKRREPLRRPRTLCRTRCRTSSASSAPSASWSTAAENLDELRRAGRPASASRATGSSIPDGTLALDLESMLVAQPLHDALGDRAEGEPRRPHPRRLPRSRPDYCGTVNMVELRRRTASSRSSATPLPEMPDELKELFEEGH